MTRITGDIIELTYDITTHLVEGFVHCEDCGLIVANNIDKTPCCGSDVNDCCDAHLDKVEALLHEVKELRDDTKYFRDMPLIDVLKMYALNDEDNTLFNIGNH